MNNALNLLKEDRQRYDALIREREERSRQEKDRLAEELRTLREEQARLRDALARSTNSSRSGKREDPLRNLPRRRKLSSRR